MSFLVRDYSYSGTLVRGHFYKIGVPFHRIYEFGDSPPPPGTIFGSFRDLEEEQTHIHAEVTADHRSEQHNCPLFKSHFTWSTYRNCRADLFAGAGGSNVPKFVCDLFDGWLVVSKEFRDELKQSKLVGLGIEKLPIGVNQSEAKPELFTLQGGIDCVRQHEVCVPEDNRCPFCGWAGPVVCPGCKDITFYCPTCKRFMFTGGDGPTSPDDPRFDAVGVPPRGWVIEGGRWDGGDVIRFVDQGIVSGRFLDFAISRKAVPFVAVPCLTDITGCTEDQLRKLDQARGDLRGRESKQEKKRGTKNEDITD